MTRDWLRAMLIAASRVCVVLGVVCIALSWRTPGIHGGELFFGGLDWLVVGMFARGGATAMWFNDRYFAIVRTNWRPYVWVT
jgi:hypothetical protein